jgi:hypothetical protein
MDIVTIAMDLLLAGLLIAALGYGMRLERKLKTLRDTQAGFAEAVRSLDIAAARAETGLETLRLTAEEAHDGLHDRIQKARELKGEMERLIGRAERAVEAAASAPPPRAERPAPVALRPVADDEPLELTELAGFARTRGFTAPAPRRQAPAAQAARPAARGLDEDLFDNAPAAPARPRRAAGDYR